MNKHKLQLHSCEIKSGQWPGNNWGTDTDTLYLQNQKWRQVLLVMGWRMKTQKHTNYTRTFHTVHGFMITRVGTMKHCTRLKTSLVGHELKDEGIKTYFTQWVYEHPCRRIGHHCNMTCGTVTGVKSLDTEHILSSLGDGRGETNIAACLRNSIVRIIVHTTVSISVHFCLSICASMDSVSLPFSAMCSSLSKQPLVRLPESGTVLAQAEPWCSRMYILLVCGGMGGDHWAPVSWEDVR